ncbi:hypothetical protein LSCM1_05530 [Leishmania martiniquensis]|uniref:Uncharacterized protein n=1 Tax=Leishmania martiniquensis TaxID=1580590 RepID=A0A836GGC2_9TRYP|nr:hypothetical protein LSCM1_05530 [Leishmania martiniquensis]
MQPLTSDALPSPSPHLSLARIEAAEQLSGRLGSENGSALQAFLQRDIEAATGTTSSGGLGGSFGGGGSHGDFTSASLSGFSSPASPLDTGADEGGGGQVRPAKMPAPSHTATHVADAVLQNRRLQHLRGRQWTPRREPLRTTAPQYDSGDAGKGGVTTVRDLVRSAGCSPSKEPRSASVSQRDSLASSFASALVPRDVRAGLSHPWVASADDDDNEEIERQAEPGARSARADSSSGSGGCSAVNSGRGLSGVASLGSSEVLPHQQEGSEVGCAPTSPRRTPSWRQLFSHPATATSVTASKSSAPISCGSSDGAAAPAHSGECIFLADRGNSHGMGSSSLQGRSCASAANDRSTAATLLGGWELNRRGGDCDDEDYKDGPSFSGVSSPSLITPLPSPRTTAPISSTMKVGAAMLSSSPVLSARELAQLEEWQGTAEVQRRDALAMTTPSFVPPLLQQLASVRPGSGSPASWRSESPSRVSFTTSLSNIPWSDRGSAAQTPLNWERSGAACGADGTCGGSRPPPACWSASELDLDDKDTRLEWRNGEGCRRVFSPMPVSLADMAGRTSAQYRVPLRSHLTSPTTSPTFAHRTPRIGQGCDSDADDRTMEDIEVRNTKRKCVESPHVSPSATSLSAASLSSSFALSLADALAAEPTRVAMSSEARLWQQQQRRRRTVSPSVARPDEGLMRCNGADTCVSTHHRDRSTFSPTSPIRTTAPSMVPMHPPELLGSPLSSSLPATCVQGHSHGMENGCTCATSVNGATAVLETSKSTTGVVVEVDDRLASSLSSCGSCGSGGEPEVDTFSLERAQAVMEDADAEATSALRARQHRLYLLATSQFAQDVERHGGHVDPVQLELEGEEEADEGDEQERRCGGGGGSPSESGVRSGTSCAISAGPRGGGAPRPRWDAYGSPLARQDGIGAKEEGEVSSSLAAARPSQYCGLQAPPPFSTVPRAIPSAGAAAVVPSQVGEGEGCATPLRRSGSISATATHVRWGELRESEDGHSPGSVATTAGSRSRRDVSPPVRERSMAPAEVRKEREGYYQVGDADVC